MPESAELVHVARQPILDARQQVFGYELLYRAAATDTAATGPPAVASARVIGDALVGVGFDVLTGGRRAFINLSAETLLADASGLLPPDRVVLEIPGDVCVTPEVVEMCRSLQARGYAIALDGYTPGTGADPLLPFAKFVKLDVLALPSPRLSLVAARLVAKGVTVVAEKVETARVFEQARLAGCSLFQGYYFCRPEAFSARALSAGQVAQMRLVSALYRPNVSLSAIEDLLKLDGSLSYRVLRTVNSAAYGLRREVRSIREALLLLGLDQVRRWAAVWVLAGANRGSSELVTMTVLRGRSCELLAQAAGGRDGGEYFLLGLCSLLDVILGRPMTEVVADLPLGAGIRDALLGTRNEARRVLDAVVHYEQGRFPEAALLADGCGADLESLADAYADALRWACEITRGDGARAAAHA